MIPLPCTGMHVHPYKRIGNVLFDQFRDEDLADLYPAEGTSDLSPVLFSCVTIFQALENSADRSIAEIVWERLCWKYAPASSLRHRRLRFHRIDASRKPHCAEHVR